MSPDAPDISEPEWTAEAFDALPDLPSKNVRRRNLLIGLILLVSILLGIYFFMPRNAPHALDRLPDSTVMVLHLENGDRLFNQFLDQELWRDDLALEQVVHDFAQNQNTRLRGLLKSDAAAATQFLNAITFAELALIGFEGDHATIPQTVLIIQFQSCDPIEHYLMNDPPEGVSQAPGPSQEMRFTWGSLWIDVDPVRAQLVVSSSRSTAERMAALRREAPGGRLTDAPQHQERFARIESGETFFFIAPSGLNAPVQAAQWLGTLFPAGAPVAERMLKWVTQHSLLQSALLISDEQLVNGTASLFISGSKGWNERYGAMTVAPIDRAVFSLIPKQANLVVALSLAPLKNNPDAFTQGLSNLLHDFGPVENLTARLQELNVTSEEMAGCIGNTLALFSTASSAAPMFTYYHSAIALEITDPTKAMQLINDTLRSPYVLKRFGSALKSTKGFHSSYDLFSVPIADNQHLYYALIKGYLVVTPSKVYLYAIIDAVDKDQSLATDGNVATVLRAAPDGAGILVVADVGKIVQEVDNARALTRRQFDLWLTASWIEHPETMELVITQLSPRIVAWMAKAGWDPVPESAPQKVTDLLLLPTR